MKRRLNLLFGRIFWLAFLPLIFFIDRSTIFAARLPRRNQINPQQPELTVFAVIGDYGIAGPPEAGVAELVKSWNPDFIVTVGDNNYPDGASWSIDQNIGQYFHEFIFPYKGRYGQGAASTRFYPALGNHDWMSNGANPYFNYFSFFDQRRYYDFIEGPLHFFILDSDTQEPDGVSATSKQARWLKNGLALSTSSFNIVVTHHPPYSSGAHGSINYMQWPFEAWGADAVLAGHDHSYERLIVDDLPFFVNGMGGDSLYEFGTIVTGSQVRYNQSHGAMRVEATSETLKFQAYTSAGALIDEYTFSDIPPRVTLTTPSIPSPSNSSSVDFAVQFSVPVTGVDSSDFYLRPTGITGAYISNIRGSGSSYVVTASTGINDGTLSLDVVDDDTIVHSQNNKLGGIGSGNGNFTSGEPLVIDKTAPMVNSIVKSSPDPSNAQRVDFGVTFSEPVIGLDFSDFILDTPTNNSIIDAITGSDNAYTVSVKPGSLEGALHLSLIDDDTISDLVGNKLGGAGSGNGNFSLGESYTIDTIQPRVISITRAGPDETSAAQVSYWVTFSESVSGVDLTDFNLISQSASGAYLSSISGSGSTYLVAITTGSGVDLLKLDLIDNNSIADVLANKLDDSGPDNGSFTNGETFTILGDAPRATSIVRQNPNPTNSPSVDFKVTFSENVSGVDLSDFVLFTGDITGANITKIIGEGNVYNISVATGAGDGILRLDLQDDDSIYSGSGVSLGAVGIGSGSFTGSESYSIDKTPPIVTSIIRASPNPTNAAKVDFIATFSEPVTGVDQSDFSLSSTGIINPSIVSIQNVDPFYVISTYTGSGTGTLRLDLIDDTTIFDLANNKLGGTAAGAGTYTAGENFNINRATVNFPPPAIPVSQNPTLTNNPAPLLKWAALRGAGGYEFTIAPTQDFSHIIQNHISNATSLNLDPPLPDGVYYWRVRALNPDLLPGRFSYSQTIKIDTIPPPVPTLLTPLDNGKISTRPVFTWEKSGAKIYQIEIDDNFDFSSPEVTSLRKDAFYKAQKLPKGAYFWRVQAKDAAGNWSDWSKAFSFSVP